VKEGTGPGCVPVGTDADPVLPLHIEAGREMNPTSDAMSAGQPDTERTTGTTSAGSTETDDTSACELCENAPGSVTRQGRDLCPSCVTKLRDANLLGSNIAPDDHDEPMDADDMPHFSEKSNVEHIEDNRYVVRT